MNKNQKIVIDLGSVRLDLSFEEEDTLKVTETPQTSRPVVRSSFALGVMNYSRLDLEKYKATVKGLTQFGDRRQGTERNRKAVDWIEAQLRSYGCANTERSKYDFTQPTPRPTPARTRLPICVAAYLCCT